MTYIQGNTAHETARANSFRRLVADPFLLLWRDKSALAAALFLLLVVFLAIFGPMIMGERALSINLKGRNLAPFSFDQGWLYVLGADSLGRSILARIIVGARYTLAIAASAVVASLLVGGLLGLIAGYRGGWTSNVIMRGADILMSFPSLLLALIVLYVIGGQIYTLVFVLALSRVPIFLRTCRAEVLEIRERMFVTAARVMGAHSPRILWRHVLPAAMPTLVNLATLEFAFVMLSESSLSFLGLGVQAPAVSWGLMVADGRAYLASAWWLSFWPGLAITLTAVSANILARWLQLLTDPTRRWRLEVRRSA
jgi:peptide/nickel transport system permease protein